MRALRRLWDGFRGAGDSAVTVPPMDGALRPNRILEEAPAVLSIEAPDNLVSDGKRTLFSSGGVVRQLDGAGTTAELHRFDKPVTALALAQDGTLAVALDDGSITLHGKAGGKTVIDSVAGHRLLCPTALCFADNGRLLIAQGSASLPVHEWRRDVMDRGATGAVWLVETASGQAKLLADGLAWPYGLGVDSDGSVAIAESWRHRIVLVGRDGGALKPVLEDLPGYPARLAPAEGGGWWLAVFAPRSQLIEFVLREPKFRARMMAGIEPDFWVAPSLKASTTYMEPLQGGALKQLGILKPWAPTRSYGLVVRLDRQFRPLFSFHSRADGRRHGITSCIEAGGRVLASSKGGDTIVEIDPAAVAPTAVQSGVSS